MIVCKCSDRLRTSHLAWASTLTSGSGPTPKLCLFISVLVLFMGKYSGRLSGTYSRWWGCFARSALWGTLETRRLRVQGAGDWVMSALWPFPCFVPIWQDCNRYPFSYGIALRCCYSAVGRGYIWIQTDSANGAPQLDSYVRKLKPHPGLRPLGGVANRGADRTTPTISVSKSGIGRG